MPDIRLNNIFKFYSSSKNEKKGLFGISLDINPGDFILITGSSGSGKTTLLSTIGGLITIDKGSIYINQHDLTRISNRKKSSLRAQYLSYVFQNNILLNELSALENILFPFQVKQDIDKNIIKKAVYLLEMFGILNLSNKKVNKLSGGEKQLINFIRAVLPDSPILLADEPNTELDHELSNQVFSYLKKLNEERNTAIVLISHHYKAKEYAKEFYEMKNGELVNYKKLN